MIDNKFEMSKKLKHIELFAGCGGLSLGLESAGYQLYFANELSPMAGETFAFNLLNEDLTSQPSSKTYWINSNYPRSEVNKRLRENPFDARNGIYSDLSNLIDFEGKLIIGDINSLLHFLQKNRKAVTKIRSKNIDLLSGGPPCQSFSLAGKRVKGDHKNTLPLSFAKIAGLLKPKIVVLENVKGITSAFTENGTKYYAWLEVAKAFALEGYVPICMMLNSKYFGVPQNRPRFILIAVRKDIFKTIKQQNSQKAEILSKSYRFFQKVHSNLDDVSFADLEYYDIESNKELFDGDIFPKILNDLDFINAYDAIEDLKSARQEYFIDDPASNYSRTLNEIFPRKVGVNRSIKNHEVRKHKPNVMSRFRIYQVIGNLTNGLRSSAIDLLTGKKVSTQSLDKILKELLKHKLYFKSGDKVFYDFPRNATQVRELIDSIPSKKHSQRALKRSEPAPSQLTIPDDLCHYSVSDLRTLTVREMARFQSFPDWFEFRSKVTTGGSMRKFEVPQYTQVGNAVPPLLARSIGLAIKSILRNA
jgi:DNA (cytosine-5)-methyltransferase 1